VAKFAPGTQVVTEKPTVAVDGLKLGKHVFTLVVVDDSGLESKPATTSVEVIASSPPPPPPPGAPPEEM
jgi:hypothetical protein